MKLEKILSPICYALIETGNFASINHPNMANSKPPWLREKNPVERKSFLQLSLEYRFLSDGMEIQILAIN